MSKTHTIDYEDEILAKSMRFTGSHLTWSVLSRLQIAICQLKSQPRSDKTKTAPNVQYDYLCIKSLCTWHWTFSKKGHVQT